MVMVTPLQLAREFQMQAVRGPATAATAVARTLVAIQADAKIGAPVDTGFLRTSITWELENPLEGEVGPEAHYGRYVEEGTSRMAPQPYLVPAGDRHLPGFEEAIEQAFGWSRTPRLR